MKKYVFPIVIALTVLFSSCSYSNVDEMPKALLNNETRAYDDLKNVEALYDGKIVSINENDILIYQTDETSTVNNSLSFVSTGTQIFSGNDFENLSLVDTSYLKEGMSVTIGFDGLVLESYPTQVKNTDFIYIHDSEINNYINLYTEAVLDLMAIDTALNSDIVKIALDLKDESNMTENEKNALAYVLGNELQTEIFFADYEQLLAEGLVTKDNPYFKDGLLITISSEEIKNDEFTFSINKWRSALGAYGFGDCVVTRNGDKFIYEIGSEFISQV